MSACFISSKIRELESEREVAKETLTSLGFQKVIRWEDLPAGSRPPRDKFLGAVDSSQLLILILWKEYSREVIEEYERARRKKIPILVFIKKLNGDWKERRNQKLQDFINVDLAKSSWREFRGLNELKQRLGEAIVTELLERTKTPFLSHSRKDLYELGEDIAGSSSDRVILLARSLILITGPRPYSSDSPYEYEKSHYECLSALVQKAKEGEIKFSCGYTITNTLKELISHPEIRDVAIKRISDLFDSSSATFPQSKFRLATPESRFDPYFTFIVGDSRFAIWFKDPANPDIYPCISSDDQQIATSLTNIFESICKEKSLEDLLTQLKLRTVDVSKATSKSRKGRMAKIVSVLEGTK